MTGLSERVRTASTDDVYASGASEDGMYEYDLNGNLKKDSRRGLEYDYNSLNLLSEVRRDGQPAAKYDWLADGTKLGVCDGSGTDGFEYVGSLIYRKSGSGLHLGEALFGDGVIRVNENGTQEVDYFLTDHLGSVRVIVDAAGAVKERNDYYPFGARHVRSDYALSTNRWKYNGKELQITGDLGFLDYGARMYDMSVGRWFGVDPLAEKYSSQSGYVFCGNNPLLFVDENGGLFTHYVDKDYNVLFQTDDGSDDVVMVPDAYVGDFRKYSDFSSGLNYIFNSLGWNQYWKDKFGLADRQFNERELMFLNGFNTGWSRDNAVEYLLKSTAGNLISMSFSEALSQWTNPELVISNLGMCLSVLKTPPPVVRTPRPYPVRPDVPGTIVPRTLYPGEVIDRFGNSTGHWASPVGTSYGARSIPKGSSPYVKYEVIKPIKVKQSLAAPGEMAGQVGYGIQYEFPESIDFYVKNYYLREIK